MPTYEYACEAEGHPYTEVRSITEDQQRTVCVKPDCGSPLKRVFSPTTTIFKGAGFASTDIQGSLLKKGQVVDY